MEQLKTKPNEELGTSPVVSNCSNKIVFGNNSPAENEWWSKAIGDEKKWRNNGQSFDESKDKYDPKANWKYGPGTRYAPGKIQSMKFKQAAFILKDIKGKMENGLINLDFMPEKYKQKQKVKDYNFTKFTSGITEQNVPSSKSRVISPYGMHKSSTNNTDDENNPIKLDDKDIKFMNTTDSAVNYNNSNNKNKKS